MAEGASNPGGTVQKYSGTQEFLRARTRSPLTVANWFGDGTLIFAGQDTDRDGGLVLTEGLAASYQNQFQQSPDLVQALGRAFTGEAVSETVRIQGGPWDARLFPTYKGDKVGGVVGIFTDARNRITAFRAVNTIELLAQIRHDLVRSDSLEQFLGRCCDAIAELQPFTWIGVADRGEGRKLNIFTGTEPRSRRFASLDLSWDVGRKGGRHPAAEAMSSGRVQIVRDARECKGGDMWCNAGGDWNSFIAVPLLAHAAFLGVLVVHSEDKNDFDEEMIGLWERVANEITEGMQLLRAKSERAQMLTEKQGAFQQYRQLFDTVFDIVVVHRNGRIVAVNPAGVKLFGAATEAEIVGSQVLTLIDPADRERMRGALRESSGADSGLQEFRLLSLDGKSIDVEGVTFSALHEGEPAGLSHWRDISERKRVEKVVTQQKTSLEYAQQVSQSGSADLEVASGVAAWSRNALVILGLAADRAEQAFVAAMSAVVVDEDKAEIAKFVANICLSAKEHGCEVTLRSEDPANARIISIHGIPRIEHAQVTRIFVVVQDISRFRDAERQLKAKLKATWRLAKVAEWTYEIDGQVIVFHGEQKYFLGYESPITSITFDQFISLIRKQDRDEVRKAVRRTLQHGSEGEVVYEQRFHEGLQMLLYTRWVPERAEDGRIVRFRGMSLDISRVRNVQQREARKELIHDTGLPEQEMAYDRLYYLATRAVRLGMPFSAIGLRVENYREFKRQMADDALYRQTHCDIAREIFRALDPVDTFARLGQGRFLLLFSHSVTEREEQHATRILREGWQGALKKCDSLLESSVSSALVHCPQHSTEWETLLGLLEKRLGPSEMM